MSLTLSMDFQFKTTIEKLWSALTDSNQLSKWVADIHTGEGMENNFKPVVGHRFQFRARPTEYWNGIIEGEVLVVEEPHRRKAYGHLDAHGSGERHGEPAPRADGHLRRAGAQRRQVRMGQMGRIA